MEAGVEGRRCLSCFAPPLSLSLIGLVLRPGSGSLLELLILLATDLEFEASVVTDLGGEEECAWDLCRPSFSSVQIVDAGACEGLLSLGVVTRACWLLWQRMLSHETASASHCGLCHLVLGSEFVAARRCRSSPINVQLFSAWWVCPSVGGFLGMEV
ncbi:hypothetical protein F2Q69_00062713 [Brassica cretica]|uniref:Uncharacterized protein n=1 Tax=Brassica cretica TaxID=69181 RepID=A0A8S9RI94_BRACR|nr:hypothetical protein F2Q69_00062713 [Brassica cretica]